MNETLLKPSRPTVRWKVFFGFHVIICVIWSGLLAIIFFAPATVPLSDDASISFAEMKKDILEGSSPIEFLLNFILLLVLTLGLYGYIYRKKIINAKFWLVILSANLIYSFYDLFSFQTSDIEGIHVITLITISILVLLLVFFESLALYRYSFKSPQIWNQSQ